MGESNHATQDKTIDEEAATAQHEESTTAPGPSRKEAPAQRSLTTM